MYSAFAEDKNIEVCFLLFQNIALDPSEKIWPEVDFRSSNELAHKVYVTYKLKLVNRRIIYAKILSITNIP